MGEAVRRSLLCGDDVILCRLTRMSTEATDALLHSEELSEIRNRVLAEGCEICPECANGAKLLVPLTPVQIHEYNLFLQPHHIVAFRVDKSQIEQVLGKVRCKRRPQLRMHALSDV